MPSRERKNRVKDNFMGQMKKPFRSAKAVNKKRSRKNLSVVTGGG